MQSTGHDSLALKFHLLGDPRRRWQKEYTPKWLESPLIVGKSCST
jgi:hypothetical protein